MSGHTAGPWSGGKDIPIRAVDQETLGYSIIYINTDSAARKDEARANARLIASAPELLEALVAIMEDMDSEFGTDFDYGKARAAIAKATGEQQ